MSTYGQFCPVAKAMEVLDERWTLLVVRELLYGSTRFNELRRGVPKMSPALLSKRLRTLERAGVVERRVATDRTTYHLTPRGRELHGIVTALGEWGIRWIGDLGDQDFDPHLLLWDMKRKVPVAAWPRRRTVLALQFADVAPAAARWWLVVSDGEVDVCDFDPGYDVTATLRVPLRDLVRVWRGDRSWAQVLADDAVELDAPPSVRRSLPAWLGQSELALVPRPGTAPVPA